MGRGGQGAPSPGARAFGPTQAVLWVSQPTRLTRQEPCVACWVKVQMESSTRQPLTLVVPATVAGRGLEPQEHWRVKTGLSDEGMGEDGSVTGAVASGTSLSFCPQTGKRATIPFQLCRRGVIYSREDSL